VVGKHFANHFLFSAQAGTIGINSMTIEAAQTKTSAAGAPSAAPTAAKAVCWSCGAAAGGGHFCAACGKIQPLRLVSDSGDADYFAFFGLPRKLAIDAEDLERRFHSLSWKLHPDNFVRADEYERSLSLERASQLNDAFRTLREPVSRLEYLLEIAGARSEGQHKQQAPPQLLAEVFELNESLDELREARQAGGDIVVMAEIGRHLNAAREDFEEKLGDVDRELGALFVEWDRLVDAGSETADRVAAEQKLFGRMNDVLNRRSYIRNLVQSVQKELAEA
jgi:molecular chaperone HscB